MGGGEQLLHKNVQRFRGGLVFKVHRLCVSLTSRLESNEEEKKGGGGPSFGREAYGFEVPLSCEYGTCKTFTARFWPWLEPFSGNMGGVGPSFWREAPYDSMSGPGCIPGIGPCSTYGPSFRFHGSGFGVQNNYFTEMCSGFEAGSYFRLIDFVYHSTLGLRVIKENNLTDL